MLFTDDDPELSNQFYDGLPEPVSDGEVVRLFHPVTNTTLSVDSNKSAITVKHLAVYAEPYVSTHSLCSTKYQ